MNLELLDKKWLTLTSKQRRVYIQEFEKSCRALEDVAGVNIEPVHHHCNGVYIREIHIPAGTALVGEIHLTDQLNVVSKGSIRVATEDGVRTITAPSTFISPAGTKRAGFALEDTVWSVVIATELTNDDDIYRKFIAPDYESLDNKLGDDNVICSNSSKCI